MKAIVLRELGGPEKLQMETLPNPSLGPDEVLIRLKAAALNHRDVWIRTGRYAGIKLPIILGSDGAGEDCRGRCQALIEASREASGHLSSDELGELTIERQELRFKILGLPDNGTYAQLIAVPVTHAFPKPASLSFEQSAALPLALLTAYRALMTRAQIQAGETCLITGIGGGVSSFWCNWRWQSERESW